MNIIDLNKARENKEYNELKVFYDELIELNMSKFISYLEMSLDLKEFDFKVTQLAHYILGATLKNTEVSKEEIIDAIEMCELLNWTTGIEMLLKEKPEVKQLQLKKSN